MKKDITVIIPAYNEGEYVVDNIIEISKCKYISKIILVDDGSAQKYKDIYKKASSYATIIIQPTNRGKEEAIKRGLSEVKTSYVLFFDADLLGITSQKLDKALLSLENQDVIIFARGNDDLIFKHILATTYLTAGERLVSKKIIDRHFTELFSRNWNLEMTMNKLIKQYNYSVTIVELAGVRHQMKFEKRSFLNGILEDIDMMVKILFINNNPLEIIRTRFSFNKDIKKRIIVT